MRIRRKHKSRRARIAELETLLIDRDARIANGDNVLDEEQETNRKLYARVKELEESEKLATQRWNQANGQRFVYEERIAELEAAINYVPGRAHGIDTEPK